MKTFVFLATILVSADAGLTILEPSCSLVSDSGQPYSDADCVKAKSKFQMLYNGRPQNMKGKKIDLPACDADTQGSSTCYTVNEALFGVNPYGEQISGMLFYKFLSYTRNAPGQSPNGCQPMDPTFGFRDDDANPTIKILLLDRGTCSFVRKVRMAQVCVFAIITNTPRRIAHPIPFIANHASSSV